MREKKIFMIFLQLLYNKVIPKVILSLGTKNEGLKITHPVNAKGKDTKVLHKVR
jgi:hypothetical protein